MPINLFTIVIKKNEIGINRHNWATYCGGLLQVINSSTFSSEQNLFFKATASLAGQENTSPMYVYSR